MGSSSRRGPVPGDAFAWWIVLWGVLGIVALLAEAIARLLPRALEPVLDGSLEPGHWAAYGGWVAFNAYAEGYRGFQKAFAPRVVARALYLARHPRPLRVALAPLFCMALFAATRRRWMVSWVVVIAVVGLVTLMRWVPQPWRGIVDGGVVVGLAWGVLAIFAYLVRAALGREPAVPHEVID